jgi:hypothetical protein
MAPTALKDKEFWKISDLKKANSTTMTMTMNMNMNILATKKTMIQIGNFSYINNC